MNCDLDLSSSATAPILRGAPFGGESEQTFVAFFKPRCRKHTLEPRDAQLVERLLRLVLSMASLLQHGKELFFTDQDRKLMAAEVKTGSGTFESEAPKLLLETQLIIEKGRNRFVVTGDGQRFLVIAPLTPPALINVTLNWTAEIKK